MTNRNEVTILTPPTRSHQLRPLPDPSDYPYGMVMIIIWYPTGENTWAGNDYVNTRDIWRPLHGRINTALVAGAEVDWSFDGFHFDSFNRRYLLHEEHLPDEKVQEAMRLLESWAVDMGFTTPIRNEFSESSEFSP